jgi:hypothetical protein
MCEWHRFKLTNHLRNYYSAPALNHGRLYLFCPNFCSRFSTPYYQPFLGYLHPLPLPLPLGLPRLTGIFIVIVLIIISSRARNQPSPFFLGKGFCIPLGPRISVAQEP